MGVFKYQSPERALFGFGSLQGIQDEIRSRKLTKALLVTGRDLADTAIVKNVIYALEAADTGYALFTDSTFPAQISK